VFGNFCGSGPLNVVVTLPRVTLESNQICQSAPTLLLTGRWTLAAAGWTDLDRTEHSVISASDRVSDSRLPLSAWSLTFRRNAILPF
jgi:hypothetical protein